MIQLLSELKEALSSIVSTGQNIDLRLQNNDDASFCTELYVANRWQEMALPNWSDSERYSFLSEQFRLQSRHYSHYYPDSDVLIVLYEQCPIGRLYLHRGQAQDWRIVDIGLLPDWCGQGIGGALLVALLRLADRYQRSCSLHVQPFNPAGRLYLRLGFQLVEMVGMDWQMRRPATGAALE